MSNQLRRFCFARIRAHGIVPRRLCHYKQEVAHQLEASTKTVQPSSALYNEREVIDWLGQFKGGRVHLSKDENKGIATILLDYPKSKNAMTGSMMRELAENVIDLATWQSGRLVRVTGANGEFCTGGDLNFMNAIADPISGAKMSIFMQTVMSRLHQLPMIVVAQISGHALGGGAELACACDFRVFTRSARIGFVQAHLGVSPGWAGATHLRRHVSRPTALRLLASGKIIDSTEAERIGLADAVVDSESELTSFSEKLLANVIETEPIRAAKTLTLLGDLPCSYQERLDRERNVFTQLWGAEGHQRRLVDVMKRHSKE